MNCGLSNLFTLKQHLLADALRPLTDYDVVIQDIGQGAADVIENECNRKFARACGATQIFQLDRRSFVVERYPLEAVTKIETRAKQSGEWIEQDLDSFVSNISLNAGIIYLGEGADPDAYTGQARITFTGGYWFETLEPKGEEGYPSEMPEGATALPRDLKLAWLTLCRLVWQAIDKTGVDVTKTGSGSQFVSGSLAGMELPPMVKLTIAQYQVMQVT